MALWLLLLLLAPAATLVKAAGHGKIVISDKALIHLDASGSLVEQRLFEGIGCDNGFRPCRITTNLGNGTLCWSNPDPQTVRCAQLDNLSQTWDLPPMDIGYQFEPPQAMAFDSISNNWFLTASRTGVSYVCSYQFDWCLKLNKQTDCPREDYYVAYDTQNGLLFSATGCSGVFQLRAERLDGTGGRVLKANMTAPSALAVDQSTQRVFWLDSVDDSSDGVFSVRYDGQGWLQVLTVPKRDDSQVLDAAEGVVTVMYLERGIAKAVSIAVGDGTVGPASEQTLPALAGSYYLLAVKSLPAAPPHQDSDNRCETAGCKDVCIPTVVDGTPEVSCFCSEGSELVDHTCQKEYPWYAVVAGEGALKMVDLRSAEVSKILSVDDVSNVDFLWTGDETYRLFWVSGGSLFSGGWSPGEMVTDVRRLVATESGSQIREVAVVWAQRSPNIVWLEKTDSAAGSLFAVKLAPLDAAYSRTILSGAWREQRGLRVYPGFGSDIALNEVHSGEVLMFMHDILGPIKANMSLNNFDNVSSGMTTTPEAFTLRVSPSSLLHRNGPMWVNPDRQTLEELAWNILETRTEHATLLTHPSLADAGGLDVMDAVRVYWTERSSGSLWLLDRTPGRDPVELPNPAGGGAVKLLNPWRQPRAPIESACDLGNNGCSHFCLSFTTAGPSVCACPDGMELSDDQKTCHKTKSAGGQ